MAVTKKVAKKTGRREIRNKSQKVALRWTPKENPGGQKTPGTKLMNPSRGEAQHAARSRMQWRVLIEALCPIGEEEVDDDEEGCLRLLPDP